MTINLRPTEPNISSINFWDEGEIESGLESRKTLNGGNDVDEIFKSDDLSLDLIEKVDFFNPCGDQYLQKLPSYASEDSVNFVEKKTEMNEVTYIVDFVDRFGKNIEFSSGVDDLDDIKLPPSKKRKIGPLNDQNIFQTRHDVSSSAEEIGEKYTIKENQIYAIGYPLGGKSMRVKEGSTASLSEVPLLNKCHVICRKSLVQNGVLTVTTDGTKYRFTRDFDFKSSTGAASVIRGKNSCGTVCWKNEAGLCINKKKYQRTKKGQMNSSKILAKGTAINRSISESLNF